MPLINFAGIASGIDSTALIKATSEATRKQRVEPNKDKISEKEEESTSLQTLIDKLKTFQENAVVFSDLSGGALSKLGQSSDENVATASASNAALNGTYTVTVTALAKNETYALASTGRTYASTSENMGPGIVGTGTVVIKVGNPVTPIETITINIDNATTLGGVISQLNSTYVQASAVNVGTTAAPSYKLVLTSNNTGTYQGALDVTVSAAITANSAFNTVTEDNAADAALSIAGIGSITRYTNTISDVITGVTFNLKGLGASNVTVVDDVATTTGKVQEMVDSYNSIVAFIRESNVVTREDDGQTTDNIFGPLAKTRLDDNVLSVLRTSMSSTNYTSGTYVKIFADMGIETDGQKRDGSLRFDSDKFEEKLAQEPNSVAELLNSFAETHARATKTIAKFIDFNQVLPKSIQNNKEAISSLNNRIAEAEKSIARQEELLRTRFSRLESVIGKLQSQQSSLTSALSGL